MIPTRADGRGLRVQRSHSRRDRRTSTFDIAAEGIIVSEKSPQKSNAKKQGKTLKEKRAAKKMKILKLADNTSKIPPTGH